MVCLHCPTPIPTQRELGCIVENSVQWTNTDTDAFTDSDTDGYCTQFGTYIVTEKVELSSFSWLLYIGITISISPSVAFLPIIGLCIGK